MKELPGISVIKSWLPHEVFAVDDAKSVKHLIIDCSYLGVTMSALVSIPPEGIGWLAIGLLQMLAGFWMWCIFVVGHDCGHGTFSNRLILNRLFGEFSHSCILLTPFYSWMLSHREHHLHHSHVDSDFSHMWIPRSDSQTQEEALSESRSNALGFYRARILMPILAWPTYLYLGFPDGSHLIPFGGRLWNGRAVNQRLHALISTLVVLGSLTLWLRATGEAFIRVYAVPWLWYGWFLFTVTYLQHHCRNTKVYDDTSWSFKKGSFETVDRIYGDPIDTLHHNISDGHVVHHMFFSTIPHYNLAKATRHLRIGLRENGLADHYKVFRTPTFYLQIWRDFFNDFYFAPLISRPLREIEDC